MALASATKSHFAELRKLLGSASARRTAGSFVVEGPVLVAELLASGLDVSYLVGSAELLEQHRGSGVDLFQAAPDRLDRALSTRSPQPIAAVARIPGAPTLPPGGLLALVDVGDPGNVGTMIRTAEAGGMAGVVLVGECADQWNPKVIRASAGAVLRLASATIDADGLFALQRGPVVATVVIGGTHYLSVDLTDAIVCMGSEAHGLGVDFVQRCDHAISIPLAGPTESLNVAAAAAIVVFAALEQRRAVTLARSSGA